MFFAGATVAGDPSVPNEDWTAATPDLLVMLDGATVRTETGCRHGAAWYTRKLGAAVIASAAVRSEPLPQLLSDAIEQVAALHPECDLTHPGTPSAAGAIVRFEGELIRYLVLGDVTVVLDTSTGVQVISDQRVSATAAAERREADRHLIGSPEKASALLVMKHAELAARNRPDGYWIAAADPTVVAHAITGETTAERVRRLAVLTDGAARAVDMFCLYSWDAALDAIAERGPREFVRRVREAESRDHRGAVHHRNKASDDATVVFAETMAEAVSGRRRPDASWTEPPPAQRKELAEGLLSRTRNAYGDGTCHTR